MAKSHVIPATDGQDDPSGSGSEFGSCHDEVYLSLGHLRQFLLVLGLFPVSETVKPSPTTSVVSGLRVSWTPRLRVFSLFTFVGIIVYFYTTIWHYIVFIPNYSEAFIRVILVVTGAVFSIVSLLMMTARASCWPSYFQNFQAIDAVLDIRYDKALRLHVGRVTKITICLTAFFVISATLFTINKIMYGDSSGPGFPLSLYCYATFICGSQFLPEFLFTCICRALSVRIKHLAEEIQHVVHGGENDGCCPSRVRDQLESCRHVYLRLMEALAGTNKIFGGALFTAGVMNPLMLTVSMYLMVGETVENPGLDMMKITMVLMSSTRLASVCLFAQSVLNEITKLKRVIFLIPSCALQLENDCFYELELFIRCIKYSRPKFTVFGFLKLDQEFLGQVSGTVLTYALALMQLK